MNRKKILSRAQGLIEQGWTRGALAIDKDGFEVSPYDPKAVCFCAVGALARALQEDEPQPDPPINRVSAFLGDGTRYWLMAMNDVATAKNRVIEELETLK